MGQQVQGMLRERSGTRGYPELEWAPCRGSQLGHPGATMPQKGKEASPPQGWKWALLLGGGGRVKDWEPTPHPSPSFCAILSSKETAHPPVCTQPAVPSVVLSRGRQSAVPQTAALTTPEICGLAAWRLEVGGKDGGRLVPSGTVRGSCVCPQLLGVCWSSSGRLGFRHSSRLCLRLPTTPPCVPLCPDFPFSYGRQSS